MLIAASAPGYLPFAPSWGESAVRVEARLGSKLEGATLWLHPAHEYRIHVSGPKGKAIAGASVRVLSTTAGEDALMPLDTVYLSDTQGELTLVAPNDALIEATHPAHEVGRARIDFAAQVSRTLSIELSAKSRVEKAKLEIRGSVVDEAGAAIDGATIAADFEAGPREQAALLSNAWAESDGDGHFVLSSVTSGTYHLTVRHEHYAVAELAAIAAGRSDVLIRMSEGGQLTGSVRDAQGAPLSAFTVQVYRREGLTRELLRAGSFFDPAGTYNLFGIPSGEVEAYAGATGLARSPEQVVTIDAKHPARADFVLLAGARMLGRVLDRNDSRPIADAQVTLEGRDAAEGTSAAPMRALVRSKADGSFEVSGVSAGEHTLFVAAAGHHARIVSNIAVPASGDAPIPPILLSRAEDPNKPQVELAGLGAVLRADGDGMRIEMVVPKGGAAEAGLVPGDLILGVDGIAAKVLGFEKAVAKIRGPVDSSVLLRVLKADSSKQVDVLAHRRLVRA